MQKHQIGIITFPFLVNQLIQFTSRTDSVLVFDYLIQSSHSCFQLTGEEDYQ